jgi:Flp pilus assembly pilin Flp
MEMIIKFTWDESGAAAVEYAFLTAFIAMVIVASVTTFGATVANLFTIPWPN